MSRLLTLLLSIARVQAAMILSGSLAKFEQIATCGSAGLAAAGQAIDVRARQTSSGRRAQAMPAPLKRWSCMMIRSAIRGVIEKSRSQSHGREEDPLANFSGT